MKTLGRIFVIILIIIAIPFIAALFITNEYAVEREISINRPKDQVFTYLKFFKNQDTYNQWILMDPALKKDYKGTDGTIGFVYAWAGEKAGKGEQEIKSISEGDRIETELRFMEPMESSAKAHMTTEALSGTETKVKWGMSGSNPYPMNFMNLFIDGILGRDLETSLSDLKNVLEKKEVTAINQ